MIERLLPPAVAAAEAYGDAPGVPLHPEEVVCVTRALRGRRQEFATGRHLARSGLVRLGLPPVGIPKGERGAPRWPEGVVGSITHCAGYRAAAVARTDDLLALGIDAEPHGPLPSEVLKLVATPAEGARLERLAGGNPRIAWDRVLFSAKESVYKAWYPLAGSFLDFDAVEVVFEEATASFAARLLVPGPFVAGERLRELTGRFAVQGGLVVTTVTIDAA
ncbi:4'-phosphopantetheinyl transferase family protein [Nonomuraea sp. NPDC003201]